MSDLVDRLKKRAHTHRCFGCTSDNRWISDDHRIDHDLLIEAADTLARRTGATGEAEEQAERLYEYVRAMGVHGPDAKPWSARSEDHKDQWRGAIAALESARQGAGMEGWRPMDSAPKDGTKFDVCYEPHGITPAHRQTDVYWSDVQDDFCTDGTYGPDEPSPILAYPRPTHWMPLPSAPQPPRAGIGEEP